MARVDGLNEFFISGQSQGRRFSAASWFRGKCENAASPLRGEAACNGAHRESSTRHGGHAGRGEQPVTRRARRNRLSSGDSGAEHKMSIEFRDRGQHSWSRPVLPLTQVPAETAGVAVCVASRTKRATVSAEVKMSAKMDALALWERPNQGERFTPRRAWSALRLSA